MRTVVCGLWGLLSGIVALSASGSAASFDCAAATNPRDRLICETPTLSALDSQLGQIYLQKRAMLTPHGAELLQMSERGWLRYVAAECPMTPDSANYGDDPAACLERDYKKRLAELAQVAQRYGPFVFNRIDIFTMERHDAADQSGSAPELYVQHLAYPQIDKPDSAAIATWNHAHDKGHGGLSSACDDGFGDGDTDYQIGYVNQRMTSVQWTEGAHCPGTPHGFDSVQTENFVWTQNLRALEPKDVFADGWEPRLRQLFRTALLATGWNPPDDRVWQDIEDIVVRPDRWLFTKDGLSVSFAAYEGGCYACNPGTPMIPWKALKPLLAPGSLVP
jgi:uncharacterized protein